MLKRLLARFKRGKKKNARRTSNSGAPRRAPVLDSGSRPSPARSQNNRGSKRKGKGRGRLRTLLLTLRVWTRETAHTLVLPAGFFIVAFGTWFFLSQPDIDRLIRARKAPSVLIKAESGQIIGSYGDIYGEYLRYEDLPQSLVDAVLATEDRNFFSHYGVDPVGVARAFVANVRAGQTVQGGSTITQQVAKNVFLTPERTFVRKLREVFLALKLESHFSKKEIMAIYLNRVYLGAGNYGVDAAARRYFNKSARTLTLSESAILAGLLKAPSRFAPTGDPQLARKRGHQVLLNMVDAGYLKPPEAEKAEKELAQTISRTTRNTSESSLYFTDWIMDQLPDYVGGIDEDLVVIATLNPAVQRVAEHAIATVMDTEGEKMNASQAALVAMDPSGAVRAMIGGRDYSQSQYNRATQAKRQPGSAFKLFVYLAALENGFVPSSLVVDQPVTIGKWQPRNYTGDYRGEMSLREAVTHSVNTVAVQVSEAVGRGNVVRMAHRLGVTSDLAADPSIALGSNEVTLLELTTGYAHLASNGAVVHPHGILAIATAAGQPLFKRQSASTGQALNESVVAMMNGMLSSVISAGTGRGASIGRPAAGKTGTTSDYRDAWFIGYTPDLVAGVWVGNDDNAEMKKVTGGTLPAPIWREFMKVALANVAVSSLPTSSGFWSGVLPWEERRERPAVARRPARRGQEFELGPQFWQKLFEGGEVRREYPQGPNR